MNVGAALVANGEAAACAASPEDAACGHSGCAAGCSATATGCGPTARGRLREKWRAFFRDVDVALCPPMPTPAFPRDHTTGQGQRRIEVDGRQLLYPDQIAWASIATLFGPPATAAPTYCRGETGLPIGVQIIGPLLEDHTPLAFAALIEREFGGFVPPP